MNQIRLPAPCHEIAVCVFEQAFAETRTSALPASDKKAAAAPHSCERARLRGG